MNRKHPITRIAHTYKPRQYYEKVKEEIVTYWHNVLPTLDGDPIEILIQANARAVARSTRFRDKFTVMKEIIASATGLSSLGDDDALAVLAGWSVTNVVREDKKEVVD